MLLLSYLDINFKEQCFREDKDFQKKNLLGKNIPPFLPVLNFQGRWISGRQAICFFLCQKNERNDLLGKNIEDQIKLLTIFEVCDTLIKKLQELEKKEIYKRTKFTEEQICPILEKLDHLIIEKKWLLDYISLADFYLYVILFHVNTIYEYTYRNYFWLQKFKISFDLLFSEKMLRPDADQTPSLRGYQKEIENEKSMQNSEILLDGKIPIENKYDGSETKFINDINYIPESFMKSIKMTSWKE